MKRISQYPEYTQETLWAFIILPFVAFAIVWAIVFSIDVLAIDDRNELDEGQHVNAVPAQVIQLSPDAYLLKDGVKVTPLDICFGGSTDGSGAEETRRINSLGGTYIECYSDQQWGVKESTINPGIFEAMSTAISKQGFIWSALIGGIVTLFFPLVMLIREMIAASQQKIEARKARKQKKLDLELARKELVRSYATPEEQGGINHIQFEDGMNKLYAQGLPPAS